MAGSVEIVRFDREPRSTRSIEWSTRLLLVGLIGLVAFIGWQVLLPSRLENLLRKSAQALSCEDYKSADLFARQALELEPRSDLALALAGMVAAQSNESSKAIELFSAIPETAPGELRRAALQGLAERQLLVGRAREAESTLRMLLALDSNHVWANWRLAYLLQVEGRCWESLPYLKHSLAHQATGADELILIGTPERVFIRDERLVGASQASCPDDPLPLLGESRHALLRANREYAQSLLERIVKGRPECLEAQARWGRLLLDSEGSEAMAKWHATLPAEADNHPEIWVTRGYWMRHLHRDRDALACFAAAIRLFPEHVAATYQLSQLFAAVGDSSSADRFAKRSTELSKLEYTVDELRSTPNADRIKDAYTLLISLGRTSEALGWCRVMLMYQPESEWAHAAVRQYRYALPEPSLALLNGVTDALLARPIFPNSTSVEDPKDGANLSLDQPQIRFRDDAANSGLDFQYVNGTTKTTGLEHMLQATGAGCGAIDFDGDSWPDIYFCQSGIWPVVADQNPHLDHLFRNRGDGTFLDVTQQAGLGDGDFSQGLAVGDFDNDGFPDLFVGNVGPDRLYHNNGDGTFSDITSISRVVGNDGWTTSAAFADFNGDSLPDLYVVNYLVLAEVLEHACKSKGRPMGCAPTMFTAEQDRLYLNSGDGHFVDITKESGIAVADGKGLGIVVADFQNRGRLDAFVGNDTTANFLFVNVASNSASRPIFQEDGLFRGVALNEDGVAQACMGIACDDANGDERLDLYVTNFYADYNTLYLQQPDLSFADMTRYAKLRDPTFNLLGFGSQFIDADLDGWPDLIVANGHVDRTFSTGVPDAMPPQLFHNRGVGKFVELSAAGLGPYFQQNLLGRSLIGLDWNRDGRQDVCVTHLDAPAALLTNQSQATGNWLGLRLCATTTARDAIGARVRLTAGDRTWLKQVKAGDGYMAANERRLVFGIGKNTQAELIEITWPSGIREVYRDLPAGNDLIAVEGQKNLIELHH